VTGDGSHSKELLLQTKAKYQNQMRDELLGRIDDSKWINFHYNIKMNLAHLISYIQ
jgi:hypothetical protein